MKTEEKILLKTNIIEVCKEQQLKTIENLKHEMDDCQQMANDYGPPKDRYDAFRNQMLSKRDMFAQQMQKANQELIMLNAIKPSPLKKKVEFGAIVIADQQKYFVAVSMGKVILGEETYLCISPAVPVFKVLSGLKTGDATIFNGNKIQITDVF